MNFKLVCINLILMCFTFEIVYNSFILGGEDNNFFNDGVEQALFKLFKQEIKTHLEDNEDNKTKELPMFDGRFDKLPEICQLNYIPKDCAAATACTHRSGIYKIKIPLFREDPFYVECDAKTDDGDWIVIQRRQDGSVDFYRDWEDYEKGFGDVDGEFFIGLKKLYALTNNNGPQELMILMENQNLTTAYAKYNAFAVANASEMYKLQKIGRYSGTAGDSLQYSIGCKFSTKDHDNDNDKGNCAVIYTAAWWYKSCHWSNLNGRYGKGINWKTFTNFTTSLKFNQMMIRRRRY